MTVCESSPVHRVDISPSTGHRIAVTGTSRVHIYDPATNALVKTLTKFKAATLCARFRATDGKLLAVGMEDGAVSLVEVATKTPLRNFRGGHENAVREVKFASDGKAVVSFSDDRTARRWDVATERELSSHAGHTDYVRAGCVSGLSNDVFISGSYDHTVRVWDARKSGGGAFMTLDHGSPVEDVSLLPNDALLVSAGGHQVKVWDLLSGGRLLTRLAPHNKTVTCLGSANGRTRLVTGSLDGHVKFFDVATFRQVHSIKFPSPILNFGVAPDDGFIACGMTDGLVQFIHRKDLGKEREKERAAFLARPANKYLQYTTFRPKPGDVLVKQEAREKHTHHDRHLRNFEHAKALNSVLLPYVVRKHPEYTYSVLVELKKRGALGTALGGRDEKSLTTLLNFVVKYISDMRFSLILIDVADELLDLYASDLVPGGSPQTAKLFLQLQKRVALEERYVKQLMALQGSLELVVAASRAALKKPALRSEELMVQREWRDGSAAGSVLGKGSITERMTFSKILYT